MKRCSMIVLILVLVSQWAVAKEGARQYLRRPDGWFAGEEAREAAENILLFQSGQGGWPKNIDTTSRPAADVRRELDPTFDNGATTDELRFLARIYGATRQERYRQAFERGMDYILKAQYANGGWPQAMPARGYQRYITFNDDAMVRLMEFLREAYTQERYAFLDSGRKRAARGAFDRGIQCILKCQIKVDGQLTAWCAQHDEKDFRPRPARTYELVSLSGCESVGIVRLLMSLDRPSPEVVASVEGAVSWFDAAKLKGIRVVAVEDSRGPGGRDKRVIRDPAAPPIWARFYEIGTNRPIYCDRDGVPKRELEQIGYERRNGYSWLSYWPQPLLEKEYPAWSRRWGRKTVAKQLGK